MPLLGFSAKPLRFLKLFSNNPNGCSRRFFSTTDHVFSRMCLEAGQPTFESHPWLLSPVELTPGVTSEEYASRRSLLASKLPKGGSVFIASSSQIYMTGIIPFPYRQHADFFYFTGITQPGVAILLERSSACIGGSSEMYPRIHLNSSLRRDVDFKYTIFVPKINERAEQWDGWCMREEEAERIFGADKAFHMGLLPSYLEALKSKIESRRSDLQKIWYHKGLLPPGEITELLSEAQARGSASCLELPRQLATLRWRKSAAEVACMAESASASAGAIRACMAASHPEVREHSLALLFEYEARRNGAQRLAYPPVVGGGVRGTVIHYSRNDQRVPGGQLVTMDAGVEMHGYASDVTRSWPVGGRFSPAQREVYAAVYEVHQACLKQCVEGGTLRQMHDYSVQAMKTALAQLGLPPESYTRFYPHALGHWLGLDTHDTPLVPLQTPFQPGAVLTIEPGLYFPDQEDIPKGLRGIGIRLEDDIVIEADGPRVLSKDVPLNIEEVEALVGSNL